MLEIRRGIAPVHRNLLGSDPWIVVDPCVCATLLIKLPVGSLSGTDQRVTLSLQCPRPLLALVAERRTATPRRNFPAPAPCPARPSEVGAPGRGDPRREPRYARAGLRPRAPRRRSVTLRALPKMYVSAPRETLLNDVAYIPIALLCRPVALLVELCSRSRNLQ